MSTAAFIISGISIAITIATQVYMAIEHRRFMRQCAADRARWEAS